MSPFRRRASEAAARRAVELLPRDPDALTALGTIVEVRSTTKAARLYADALAIDPHHGAALLGLARVSPDAARKAVLARAAGRDRPYVADAMGLLVATARVRMIAAMLLVLAPFVLVSSYLVRPAGYAIATLGPLIAAVVIACVVAQVTAPHIARRWAGGGATRVLFDRGIAAGKPISRARELLVGAGAGAMIFCVSVALVALGGGFDHPTFPGEGTIAESEDGNRKGAAWELFERQNGDSLAQEVVNAPHDSRQVTRQPMQVPVETPYEQHEWVGKVLIAMVVVFTFLFIVPLFQTQPLRQELDLEMLDSDA